MGEMRYMCSTLSFMMEEINLVDLYERKEGDLFADAVCLFKRFLSHLLC